MFIVLKEPVDIENPKIAFTGELDTCNEYVEDRPNEELKVMAEVQLLYPNTIHVHNIKPDGYDVK